jgi:hypothetical protein
VVIALLSPCQSLAEWEPEWQLLQTGAELPCPVPFKISLELSRVFNVQLTKDRDHIIIHMEIVTKWMEKEALMMIWMYNQRYLICNSNQLLHNTFPLRSMNQRGHSESNATSTIPESIRRNSAI